MKEVIFVVHSRRGLQLLVFPVVVLTFLVSTLLFVSLALATEEDFLAFVAASSFLFLCLVILFCADMIAEAVYSLTDEETREGNEPTNEGA